VSGLQRLLVVSHVAHFEHEGRLFAYGPYARELDIWADLFGEVVIAAPLRQQHPPADVIAFSRSNVSIVPQLETGGDDVLAKALQLLALPVHIWRLSRTMWRADAIQVRCPGNLGLLGCLLAPWFRKPRVAKYAGQWNNYEGEPWTWRWQKSLLHSHWWEAPVLVYGDWPGQPAHVLPFFTSVMDEGQMVRTRGAAARDWSKRPLEILFVGRLSEAKNVDVILRAIGQMQNEAEGIRLRIVGDGPMRGSLQALARELEIGDKILFEGAVPQTKVLDFYEQGDVLVIASQTEGWPKAIAEAMAFGLVCVGSNRGFVPQMLGEGRGLLVEPRDTEALAFALRSVLNNPAWAQQISKRAAAWAQKFTLERFRDALRSTLDSAWGVRFGGGGLGPSPG